jgi:hypothetical protein
MLAVQLPGIDSGQTIDVDGDGRRSIGHLAVGKTLNTAGATEKMPNLFLVKTVLGEILLPGLELKVLLCRECEDKAHALTARAVAGDRILEIYLDFKTYRSTLATAFVMRKRHCFNPFSS